MDSRRLAYLKALEIDLWERRALQTPRSDTDAAAAMPRPVAARPVVTPATREARSGDRPPPAPAASPRVSPGRAVSPNPSVTPGLAGSPAVSAASASGDVSGMGWEELFAAVRSCTLCPLHTTRTQSVFGVGNRSAQWMVIGEAPGMDEDRQGEPFVGRAGQLLNSMLKAIGLAREEVFIANILKSRPPNNRDPRPEEVRACLPYLFRQIELVNPKLILCVGRIAAQTLLETATPIGKLRGTVHRIGNRPMIVTYHPAYLLRSPGEKRKSWMDLLLAMRTFGQVAGGS